MDVELEMGWEWGEFRPRRWLLALLAAVVALVLLWLLGRGHTPVVSGRPAVLTPHRKAVLDYLARADGWLGSLEGLGQTLEGLMPVSATIGSLPDVTAAITATGWITIPEVVSTEGISLPVPILPTATPMPVASPLPLPDDLLARVERLDRVRLALERMGAELETVRVPAGMEGVHRQIAAAAEALSGWNNALLQYYSAPESLSAVQETRAAARSVLDDARRALASVRAVVLGGGEW